MAFTTTCRLRLALGVLLALFAAGALAQEPPADTLLRLKNGGEVRGRLVEVKNGTYVLIGEDGRTLLYPTSDVDVAERIAKPPKPPTATGDALLAPGHRVHVKPYPGNDIYEVVGNHLREWGRWKVVDKPEEAEIQVRLVLGGSAGWGKASIVAIIDDLSTGTELWKSKKQTGYRTLFHGYDSPYHRAALGILEQMKKASATWPKE